MHIKYPRAMKIPSPSSPHDRGRFAKCLVALVAALVFCSCGERERLDPNLSLKTGIHHAAENGDWKSALYYADEAARAMPENSDALVLHALALEQVDEDNKGAIAKLQKAVGLDPDHYLANLSLGRILHQSGKHLEALPFLVKARNIRPDNLDATILLAACGVKVKSKEALRPLAQLAKEPQMTAGACNELGVYFTETGNDKLAAKFFQRAYREEKDNPVILANMAIFCDRRLKDPQKAAALYKMFLKASEDDPELEPRRELARRRLEELGSGG